MKAIWWVNTEEDQRWVDTQGRRISQSWVKVYIVTIVR